jgi:hypothetical protein
MMPERTRIDAEEPCEKTASAIVRFEFTFHAQPGRWSGDGNIRSRNDEKRWPENVL